MDSSPARRGRPSVINRPAIASAALRLWRDNGFDATTWQHIADATGVSARSLVRHFGSQTALMDVGIDRAIDKLRETLETRPALNIADALAEAIAVVVDTGMGEASGASDWAEVIAREPALQDWMRNGYQPWIEAISDAVHARRPDIPAEACHAIAAAYEAATSAALLGWATSGAEGDPGARVRDLLRWLRVTDAAASKRPGTNP